MVIAYRPRKGSEQCIRIIRFGRHNAETWCADHWEPVYLPMEEIVERTLAAFPKYQDTRIKTETI